MAYVLDLDGKLNDLVFLWVMMLASSLYAF